MTVVHDGTVWRRTRLGQGILLVGLGLVLLAAGLWRAVAHDALSRVSVAYDAAAVVCRGADVLDRSHGSSAADAGYLRPVVVLTEAMDCTLRIQVVNDGWRDVEVTRVSLQLMGEPNTLGVEARFVNPNGQAREVDDRAAVFTLDGPVIVPAGELATLEAVFGDGGRGQISECAAVGVNVPSVTFTTLGVEREAAPPARDLIWFQQGHSDSCT